MLTIETTAQCRRTPLLLFTLEEAGLPYAVELREDGYFSRVYSSVGPVLRDDEVTIWGLDAALRHVGRLCPALVPASVGAQVELDCWIELLGARLRPFAAQWARATMAGATAPEAEAIVRQCLTALERRLGDRDYLLGEFSLADCTALGLMALRTGRFDLSSFPAVTAYLDRLTQRPAFSAVAVGQEQRV